MCILVTNLTDAQGELIYTVTDELSTQAARSFLRNQQQDLTAAGWDYSAHPSGAHVFRKGLAEKRYRIVEDK